MTQILAADGTAYEGSLRSEPFGFGAQFGYYTDRETGLVLCTLRYYDPSTGRWLNQDPIGYSGGINLYAYVSGNPINAVDPLGLDDQDLSPRGALLKFLTGWGKQSITYTYGDRFLTELIGDKGMDAVRTQIRLDLQAGKISGSGRKSLAQASSWKPISDAWNVFTGWRCGESPETSFIGSYGVKWSVTSIDYKRRVAVVAMSAFNDVSATSGTRIPGVGYDKDSVAFFTFRGILSSLSR